MTHSKYIFTEQPITPKNLHVSNLTDHSVTLSWDQPLNQEVKQYYIDCRAEGETSFTSLGRVHGQDTSFTYDLLDKGLSYQFRISAKNQYGLCSDFAELPNLVSLKSQKS